MKKHNFTKQQIIEIGNKLANAGLITKYAPRSHSHDSLNLFPQTEAQYNWLKRNNGTTSGLIVLHTEEKILTTCPELIGFVSKTKSGRFCRINITLY